MKKLSSVEERFVLHWGEMGVRWGINRTVAQMHALLFISPEPLTAEAICDVLGVARSNVSNSLRELQNWKIVKVVHIMGDRRDHFESLKDVWQLFRVVLDERKRREIDPTLAVLKECIEQAAKDKETSAYTEQRLRDLHVFFETTDAWYQQVSQWPTATINSFLKLGDKAKKLLGLGE